MSKVLVTGVATASNNQVHKADALLQMHDALTCHTGCKTTCTPNFSCLPAESRVAGEANNEDTVGGGGIVPPAPQSVLLPYRGS